VTGVEWIEALCRTREFAEYMLYGYFVQNDQASALRHTVVPATPCVSYWDDPTLSKTDLTGMLRRADRDHVAFSIPSFSGTPVDTIRAAISESESILTPAAIDEPKGSPRHGSRANPA
jgi:hypothetical protein